MDEVRITSGGTELVAGFRRNSASAACIVLAHGFGLVLRAGLVRYIERFYQAGYSVLAFDYRHFGGSGGSPRGLVHVRRQLEDWMAAVAWVRSHPDLDPSLIALWGTSLSGGHVVVTAARDQRIAAAVAQVPFLDGLTMISLLGARAMMRQTPTIFRDIGASFHGRVPHRLPLAGPPGTVAALPVPGAAEGYAALLRDTGEQGVEAVPARALLRLPLYRPIRHAGRVRCPLLLQVAEQDRIAPAGPARRAGRLAPRAVLETYPGDHFDIYEEPNFTMASERQVVFLGEHLLAARARARARPA
jgi:uncharacterized protein